MKLKYEGRGRVDHICCEVYSVACVSVCVRMNAVIRSRCPRQHYKNSLTRNWPNILKYRSIFLYLAKRKKMPMG